VAAIVGERRENGGRVAGSAPGSVEEVGIDGGGATKIYDIIKVSSSPSERSRVENPY
jgi:hypothetical protein